MTHERGTAPRPVFETLPKAVLAAQMHGNSFTDINPIAWSRTYGCEPEQLKIVWEQVEWERTQQPQNGFEDVPCK